MNICYKKHYRATVKAILIASVALAVGPLTQAQVVWGNSPYVKKIPVGIHGFSKVSAGDYDIAAIMQDSLPVCWGEGFDGQNDPPVGVSFTQISGGQYFTAGVTTSGSVECWGNDGYGQCEVPPGLPTVLQVAAGIDQVTALLADGSVTAWGNHGSPYLPSLLPPIAKLAGQDYQFVGIDALNNAHIWGFYIGTQTYVAANVAQAASGSSHFVFLHLDGSVSCLGDNSYHQCDVPTGLKDVVQVAAGSYFSVALKSDGTVVCWGDNSDGGCNVPAGLTGVVQLSANHFGVVAIPKMTFTMDAKSIKAGDAGTGSVWLNGSLPGGATVVNLTSADPAIVVPSTVTVLAGNRSATFSYSANPVSSTKSVTVTATTGGVNQTAQISVTPGDVSISIDRGSVIGGSAARVTGTVTLTGPAPAGGVTVSLSSSNGCVSIPTTVKVSRGSSFARFVITHSLVATTKNVTITATGPTNSIGAAIDVNPLIVNKISASPNPTFGGGSTSAVVTFNAYLGSDVTVNVTSSEPGLIGSPGAVLVPKGSKSITIPMSVGAVTKIHKVTLTATFNGSTEICVVTVKP